MGSRITEGPARTMTEHRTTPRRRRRRVIAPALILLVAIAIPTLLPGAAVVGGSETYTSSAFTSCGTNQNGGQYDEQKRVYMGCGTKVRIRQADGTWANREFGVGIYDVAPSPTGAHVFVLSGAKVHKFNRKADGTYARDATWALPKIKANGWEFAANVAALATDANGNLYLSHGAPADNVITKHKPDGTQLTWFGGYTNTKEIGRFYLNRGVAPSRDGRYVYVVEKSGGRIQRFDYQLDGSYAPAKAWGRTDNNCTNGNFAAPGDVVVDPWGWVYIMDTTCARVQKFDDDGRFIWSKKLGTAVTNKSHRFAVDWRGSVYVSEQAQKQLVRAAGTEPTTGYPVLKPLPEPPFLATPRADVCPVEDWTNGAGQAAKDGTVYIACGHSVFVVEGATGTAVGRIALPAGAHYYDVAPSPDEQYLYVTRRTDGGPKSVPAKPAGRAELVRFNRVGATGLTYTLDAAWKPAQYTLAGKAWTPQGQFVATDAWGDIYYSIGGWSGYYTSTWDGEFQWEASPAIIVKYGPTGAVKTQMIGEATGDFDVNMGVSTTRDGRTVWTVEHKSGRLQRFDYDGARGEYHQTAALKTFGGTDATCAGERSTLTPYDLGVDPWGNVWVANTACRRADLFQPDGTRLASIALGDRAHGIAVDLDGGAWVGQRRTWLKRSTQNPKPGALPALEPLPQGPAPDTQAPTLAVVFPKPDGTSVTTTQAITVQLNATDDVGVTEMRLTDQDGNYPTDAQGNEAWVPYSANAQFTLNPPLAAGVAQSLRGVYVQVRDAKDQRTQKYVTIMLKRP